MTETSPNMPLWAKNIDDYGKRRWNKEKHLRNRRGEYIAAMIILFYIYPFDFSGIPDWLFLDWLIPWMLIIGMIVSALKMFGNIWKLIFWR
jgi:hypothetical protein